MLTYLIIKVIASLIQIYTFMYTGVQNYAIDWSDLNHTWNTQLQLVSYIYTGFQLKCFKTVWVMSGHTQALENEIDWLNWFLDESYLNQIRYILQTRYKFCKMFVKCYLTVYIHYKRSTRRWVF